MMSLDHLIRNLIKVRDKMGRDVDVGMTLHQDSLLYSIDDIIGIKHSVTGHEMVVLAFKGSKMAERAGTEATDHVQFYDA